MPVFGSDSKSSTRNPTISGPQTASEGAQNFALIGRNDVNQGLHIERIASGAEVTFNTTDYGAIAAASSAIERVVQGQADTTAASLAHLGNLTETRESGGSNITADVTKTAVKWGAGAAVAIGLVLLVFLLRRK